MKALPAILLLIALPLRAEEPSVALRLMFDVPCIESSAGMDSLRQRGFRVHVRADVDDDRRMIVLRKRDDPSEWMVVLDLPAPAGHDGRVICAPIHGVRWRQLPDPGI